MHWSMMASRVCRESEPGEQRFAGPHITRDEHESFPPLGGVDERSQGFFVIGGAEEEARIGCVIKRGRFESKELAVHGRVFLRMILGRSSVSNIGPSEGGLDRRSQFPQGRGRGLSVRYIDSAAGKCPRKTGREPAERPALSVGCSFFSYIQPGGARPDNATGHGSGEREVLSMSKDAEASMTSG